MGELPGPSPEEIEEAYKFNELHQQGNATGEYLSVLPKDQSPEKTQEILEKAERRIQDINTLGVLAHGVRYIDQPTFKNAITEGLKTKNQLLEEGKIKVERLGDLRGPFAQYGGGDFGFTLFPDSIACTMNGFNIFQDNTDFSEGCGNYGVTFADSEAYGTEKGRKRYLSERKRKENEINLTFIVSPKYLSGLLKYFADKRAENKRMNWPIKFQGATIKPYLS